MIGVTHIEWPGGVEDPGPWRHLKGSGDAVVLYYTQTRSRQGAGLLFAQKPRPRKGRGRSTRRWSVSGPSRYGAQAQTQYYIPGGAPWTP